MILGNEPWKAWITFAKTRVNLFISSHTFEYIYKKTFSLILSLLPGWGFSFSHAYVQLTLWFKLFRFNPFESFHCCVVVYSTGMSRGLFKTLFSIFGRICENYSFCVVYVSVKEARLKQLPSQLVKRSFWQNGKITYLPIMVDNLKSSILS